MFLVWRGETAIEFHDDRFTLTAGEFLVVPRGVEHRTLAEAEAEVLVFEPAENAQYRESGGRRIYGTRRGHNLKKWSDLNTAP